MVRKRFPKKNPVRKKKSMKSFFIILAVSLAVGLPLTFSLRPAPSNGSVQGISSASGSGTFKPTISPKIVKPAVYLSEETLSRGNCFPEFQKVEYTCSNGYKGAYDTTACVSVQQLLKSAEYNCASRSITGTPSPKLNTSTSSAKFPQNLPH